VGWDYWLVRGDALAFGDHRLADGSVLGLWRDCGGGFFNLKTG